MAKQLPNNFMRQFEKARQEIAAIEKLFPGVSRVATLTFPRLPRQRPAKTAEV